MNVLLVEPNIPTRYPNLALMKLSAKHKNLGDVTIYIKGEQLFLPFTPDIIYISTMFTYYSKEAIRCISYYKNVFPDAHIEVGGIFASLMPEYIKEKTGIIPFVGCSKELDMTPPDYTIVKDMIKVSPYIEKWKDFSMLFSTRGCPRRCAFCLHPDTDILISDNSLKKIKDVKIGDSLIGFVNEQYDGGTRHKLVPSKMIGKQYSEAIAYEIELKSGKKVICSGDHQWLTCSRGWKYTYGTMGGKDQRPYLTKRSKIKSAYNNYISDYSDTEEYKKGYIAGIYEGDGCIYKIHDKRSNYIGERFKVAMTDQEPLDTIEKYLNELGVNNIRKRVFYKGSIKHKPLNEITTGTYENMKKIKEIINLNNNDKEFRRGFVAGFFDAEGSNTNIIRLHNTDIELINMVESILTEYGFFFSRMVRPGTNYPCYTITLHTRKKGALRFYNIFKPKIKRKFEHLFINRFLFEGESVVSIKKLQKMELIDIQTETENFIANGLASHNCAVYKLEPTPEIIPNWKELIDLNKKYVMFQDNNITNTPIEHFREVFNFIKEHKLVACFNNGLDARILTEEQMQLMANIKWYPGGLRLAFDNMTEDVYVQKCVKRLLELGVSKSAFLIFCLFNFYDTPEEAMYRHREMANLGVRPYPQVYWPLNKLNKDEKFIGKHWNMKLIQLFRTYWLLAGNYKNKKFEDYLKENNYIVKGTKDLNR